MWHKLVLNLKPSMYVVVCKKKNKSKEHVRLGYFKIKRENPRE